MRDASERAQALYNQWADAFSTALENSTSGQTNVDSDVQKVTSAYTKDTQPINYIKKTRFYMRIKIQPQSCFGQ